MAEKALNRKEFALDTQTKHSTQDEIGQVLYLEHCIVWLRGVDSNKIGPELVSKSGDGGKWEG